MVMLIGLALLCVSLIPASASANQCQLHILNAGINLGWAQATLELRGDQNPQDARRIAEYLNNASAHILAAAALFQEPYRAERNLNNVDQEVVNRIEVYFQRANRMSLRHRANYVSGVWSMYRQGFQSTFTAPTSGFHYNPNCDFFILDTGYHFGRAHIASGIEGANSVQSGANRSMRSAIRNGLSIAVDGYEYGTQNNARKACCCFGKETFWRQLPKFHSNSPFRLYSDNLGVLQRIVAGAGVEPEPCSCGGTKSKNTPTPQNRCKAAIGAWQWFNGVVVRIENNNSFRVSTGENGGTWQCLSNGQIRLNWRVGGWQDTISISSDGNTLLGKNQHGGTVSAKRTSSGESSSKDCSHCKNYEEWIQKHADACNYHGRRLPSICENDPECVQWNRECSRVLSYLKDCANHCR